jgi:hypothetical protein
MCINNCINGCDCDIVPATGPQGPAGTNGTNGTDGSDGADGAAGVDGNDGAAGADGSNGTNGTNGADGVSVLHSYLTAIGSGVSSATTSGAFATIAALTYTLPAALLDTTGDYLDIDIKLACTGVWNGSTPENFFRIMYNSVPLSALYIGYNSGPADTLLALAGGIDGEIRVYNINIKLYYNATGPALQAQVTWNADYIPQGYILPVYGGAIQIDPGTAIQSEDLNAGGDIEFQVAQKNTVDTKIEVISIKHINA